MERRLLNGEVAVPIKLSIGRRRWKIIDLLVRELPRELGSDQMLRALG